MLRKLFADAKNVHKHMYPHHESNVQNQSNRKNESANKVTSDPKEGKTSGNQQLKRGSFASVHGADISSKTSNGNEAKVRSAPAGIRVKVSGDSSPPPEQPPPRVQSMLPAPMRAVARTEVHLTRAAPIGRKERGVHLSHLTRDAGSNDSSRSSSSSSSLSNKSSSSPSDSPRNSPTKGNPVSIAPLVSSCVSPSSSSAAALSTPASSACQASKGSSHKSAMHNHDKHITSSFVGSSAVQNETSSHSHKVS